MLLAITPNPTIDRTLQVSTMQVGQVHRATDVHLAAGGKGLNVSRVALTLDAPVLTSGPLAGHTGRLVAALAKAEGLPADWYWHSSGETRNCILINHNNDDATVINEAGPVLSAEDWQGFAAHITTLAEQAQAITFSGSLPRGIEGAAYATLVRAIASRERPVYVDTSGPALQAILANPRHISLKVNQTELATGLNLELKNIEQVLEAGRLVLDRGATMVVVTLGGDGALAITPQGSWRASSPSMKVVSTVGSGDSALAGLVIALLTGQYIADALAFSVACGTANVLTNLPGRVKQSDVETLLGQIVKTKMTIL